MTDTIYSAPKSELVRPREAGTYGSLDRGIAGDYPLDVDTIMREAWQKTSGAKLPIMLALVIYAVIYGGIAFGAAAIQEAAGLLDDKGQPVSVSAAGIGFLVQLVVGGLGAGFGMGLFLMGLRRAVDASISVSTFFVPFARFLPLMLTALLMQVLVFLGVLALIIPGIYLSIAYYLALPLVVDKQLGPWRALESSRKAVGSHWWGTFVLLFGIGLLNVLGALALLVGLIWTIPMSMIALGIFYRDVFGVEPATTAG